MSLPTYQIRPNESNPTILRTLQFLVQANMLMNKNILDDEQKKTLIMKVEALVQELNKRYKLDEELNKEKDSLKRMDSLTSAFQQTFEFTENRRVLEELSEEIAETKIEIQKNHSDIRYLSCSVERVKNQIKKETEKHEKRKLSALKVNEELKKKSENIRKNLENSTAVSKLRRLEEEKRLIEKSVEELKNAEAQTLENIKIMKATLKSENKKPFVKLVVEIAKQWRSYNVLLPKLERSRKNVEKLKVEEAARRASGSLDDTIVFDNSFVKATQDNNTTLNINSPLNTSRASIAPPQTKTASIPQVVPMTTSQSTEQMNISVRSISSNHSEQQQQSFLPPRNVEPEQIQEQEEESMDQSNYEVNERMNSRNTTLEQNPEPRVEEEEEQEIEFGDNNQQEDSQPQEIEEIAEPQNDTINNEEEEEEAIEENIEEPQEEEEQVHNNSVRSNSGKNTSGFFDNLLAGKKTGGNGNGKKKDIADTILDISMNSVDGGSDLLKEMENRMEEDRNSQGSQVDNFSFNIFNAAGSTANSESNFDFDFGGGGGGAGGNNNDNFDFFGGGDSPNKGAASGEGAQASSSDPFGFGKASNAENSGFSFNFDDAGSSGGGAGNSSFFNF